MFARDIDYAASAVKTALTEKFGQQNELPELAVEALDNSIVVRDGKRTVDGTRDRLMAAVRRATTYEEFWEAAGTGD